MGERLKGRNAVITGAGKGIGKAMTLALAQEGANVVVCDLGAEIDGTGADRSRADAVMEECRQLGVGAVPHYGDVADFQAARDMVDTCVGSFGSIDILCNIAGNKPGNNLFTISEEAWDRTIAIHLKGTFNLIKHAAPLMRDQGYGRIVNCISDAWLGTEPVHYAAAKGGIASLTYATALEMGKYGVTCNAFSPIIGTRYSRDNESEQASEMVARLGPKVDSGSWSRKRFDEITDALMAPMDYTGPIIAFLCSDKADYINGRIFGIAATKLSYWSSARQTRVFSRDWQKQGGWTWEEVEKNMPTLLGGWR